MSEEGPGPWADCFAFPHRYQVGDTVWVGEDGPWAGRLHAARTEARISFCGRAFGNPCYDLVTPSGDSIADDIPEDQLSDER